MEGLVEDKYPGRVERDRPPAARVGLCRNSSGAAAVEFAVVSPVFFLMLFGMIAYAIYFGAAHSVQQIAADASRTSIAGLDAAERDMLVSRYIETHAANYWMIEPARLSYRIGTDPDDPAQYSVTIAYDASGLPIWNLHVPLPLPASTIRHASTIRMGGI